MQQQVNIRIEVDLDSVVIKQVIKTLTIIQTISFEELSKNPEIMLSIFPTQNIQDKDILIDFS
jgi:hypothetical protein